MAKTRRGRPCKAATPRKIKGKIASCDSSHYTPSGRLRRNPGRVGRPCNTDTIKKLNASLRSCGLMVLDTSAAKRGTKKSAKRGTKRTAKRGGRSENYLKKLKREDPEKLRRIAKKGGKKAAALRNYSTPATAAAARKRLAREETLNRLAAAKRARNNARYGR